MRHKYSGKEEDSFIGVPVNKFRLPVSTECDIFEAHVDPCPQMGLRLNHEIRPNTLAR